MSKFSAFFHKGMIVSYPDPDPTCQVITDPDPTCQVISDPDR